MDVAKIALPIILGLIVLLTILSLIFRLVQKKMLHVVAQRFKTNEIVLLDLGANFFGLSSKGLKQVRGNGALVMTENQLWFHRAAPSWEISIPLEHIRAFDLRRTHLGKGIAFKSVLYVEFISEIGQDSIAWALREPQKWIDALTSATRKAPLD